MISLNTSIENTVSPFQLELMTFCVTLYLYLYARAMLGVGSEKLSGFFSAKMKKPGMLRSSEIAKIFDETKMRFHRILFCLIFCL